MTTRELLEQELATHKGQLVLFDWHMARLLGIAEDETDIYWVTRQPGRGTVWHSCVGRFIPLKGKLDQRDYDELERTWVLNQEFWPD